jgi:hypothetical protein
MPDKGNHSCDRRRHYPSVFTCPVPEATFSSLLFSVEGLVSRTTSNYSLHILIIVIDFLDIFDYLSYSKYFYKNNILCYYDLFYY